MELSAGHIDLEIASFLKMTWIFFVLKITNKLNISVRDMPFMTNGKKH